MKEAIQSFLQEKFQHFISPAEETNSNLPTIHLKPEGIVPVLTALKTEPGIELNYLNDLTAIDWLGKKTPRFEICYLLRSGNKASSKIQFRVALEDGEEIPSITGIFKGANWPEREVYDLFGIRFLNHPRMDRLIMPDNFQGHPLRKDYPLEGFGQDYLVEDLLTIHLKDDLEA